MQKEWPLDNYSYVRAQVYSSVCDALTGCKVQDDGTIFEYIRKCIVENPGAGELSSRQRAKMSHELFNRIRRLDVLTDLLEDDGITEIMVNGTEEIFVERAGRLERTGVRFESKERLIDIIGRIASDVNRTINLSSPILDARLADGSRVNAVLDPIAINGPILTIRRFTDRPVDAQMLVRTGSISQEALECLSKFVRAGYNILISGCTGSGKTTFLNILSGFIPKDERVITIEDSAELKIMGIRNLVRLETRNKTAAGTCGITIRDLIRTSLRMRPDRIVVGEVRGEEAIDMLQAFNVGQDGSLSTIHANSAADALSRLETMIMLSTNIPQDALRRQIISGVDIIVHLGRLRDKSRHVLEIIEVDKRPQGAIRTRTLFKFTEDGFENGKIRGVLKCENGPENTEKLERAGLMV